MTAELIDGKAIANQIKQELKIEVEKLKSSGIVPGLATLLVGEDPASQIYVRNKHKACQEIGIASFNHLMPKESSQKEVLEKMNQLNLDPKVHAILVQLPLPAQINPHDILYAIKPSKDADGFHPVNLGRLFAAKDLTELRSNQQVIPLPCTPYGVLELLDRSKISIQGKNAVVVGRSMIVGKPMAALLLARHATVTVTHSQTKNLIECCRSAELLVAAIGKAKFIEGNMVKEGAAVIDVGINRNANGSLSGDVDFEAAKEKAGWITPVPGGVGPMTIVMLLKNTVELCKAAGGT